MTAKSLIFKLVVAAMLPAMQLSAETTGDSISAPTDTVTPYEQRVIDRKKAWTKLMPDLFTVQYAGGIGMFSGGIGWHYGRSRQFETHLLVGFTPKQRPYPAYWTVTLRETYNPWRLAIGKSFAVKPLSVNLALNSILHHEFWTSEPDRYPKGYYGFSSRMRIHLGVGQRFIFVVPESKRRIFSRVAVYYEVSTCDLYIRQKALNHNIPWRDILTLGVGVQWTM